MAAATPKSPSGFFSMLASAAAASFGSPPPTSVANLSSAITRGSAAPWASARWIARRRPSTVSTSTPRDAHASASFAASGAPRAAASSSSSAALRSPCRQRSKPASKWSAAATSASPSAFADAASPATFAAAAWSPAARSRSPRKDATTTSDGSRCASSWSCRRAVMGSTPSSARIAATTASPRARSGSVSSAASSSMASLARAPVLVIVCSGSPSGAGGQRQERLEHPRQPRPARRPRHLADRLRGTLVVVARVPYAHELQVQRGSLVLTGARRDEALGGVFVPRRVADDARERPRDAPDDRGRHAVHRSLAQRRLRPCRVVRPHRPHERREEERATARLVGRQVVGEGLELRGERARVPAVGEHVELQRARRQTPRIVRDRPRERLDRSRRIAHRGRVLGDAKGQRRRQAAVLLGRQPPLGHERGERGIPGLLGDSDARVRQRRRRERHVAAVEPREVLEGAVEDGPRAVHLPHQAARLRAAQPRVDETGRLPHPRRHPEGVASGSVGERLLHQVRDRIESVRVHLAPRPRLLGARARVLAHDLLQLGRRNPRRLRPETARLFQQRDRGVDLPRGRREPRPVHEQQSAPGRLPCEPRALRQPLLAGRRVPRSPREHLEGEPGASLLGGRRALHLGRLPRRRLGFRQLARYVGLVGGPHEQRAHLLVGRDGGTRQRVDELPQVLETPSLLEQPHEPLEGLSEHRVGVERRQVIAGGGGLVAGALLEIRDGREQAGLAATVGRRRELGAKPAHRLLHRLGRFCAVPRRRLRGSRSQRLRGLAERGGVGHARWGR